MILDLDAVSWAHIARALGEHVRWARTQAIAVPADVLRLAELAAGSASNRQDPTKSPGWSALVTTDPVDPLLTDLDGAAVELGVSRRTVERLVASEELPSVRVKGAVRVRRADLESYVDGLSTRGGAA